jgi:hypothetical protein
VPWCAPSFLATSAGNREACVRTFLHQPSFKLRQRGKNAEDELPGGRRRIKRPITQRAKVDVPLEQGLNQRHQMGHRPPQAIEPPDHQRVSWL